MAIRTVGVIGAGQMGSGIAQVCAVAGFDVKLNDVTADKIDQALVAIEKNLGRAVKSGRITADAPPKALASHPQG